MPEIPPYGLKLVAPAWPSAPFGVAPARTITDPLMPLKRIDDTPAKTKVMKEAALLDDPVRWCYCQLPKC